MKLSPFNLRFGLVALAMIGLTSSQNGAADPISFKREIAPILQKKCIACHSPEKSKGGYQMHTFESLLRPGKSKEKPISSGKPSESKLYQLITSTDSEDRMPQKDDPLPQEQIGKIRQWISEGATFDGDNPKALLVDLIPEVPTTPAPHSYARPVAISALLFNEDYTELLVGGYHELTVWSVADGHLISRQGALPQRIQSLALGSNGLLAVAGGQPGQRGEALLVEHWAMMPEPTKLGRAADMVLAIRFSPDGQTVAWAGTDNAIHISDTISHKENLLIQQHADWILDLNFNKEGTKLISASRDRSARIYDAKTGELESTYTGHDGPVNTAVFTPDSTRAISGGLDKKIHLWNTKDGSEAGSLGTCDGEILRIRVAANDVFVASSDNMVRQYNLNERKLKRILVGPAEMPFDLAIGGTNSLAAGYYDGQVQVWNLITGAPETHFVAAPGYR